MKGFDEEETDPGNLLKSLAPPNSPTKGLKGLADLFPPRPPSNSPAKGLRKLADLLSPPPTVGSPARGLRALFPSPADSPTKGSRSLADLLSPPPVNSLARGLGEQGSANALIRRLTKSEEGGKKMEKAKRRVFYSFHYKPDVIRASQVRQIGAIEGNKSATDNEWEKITSSKDEATKDKAIKKWIEDQMDGRTCCVVLVGKDTANRKWINHEIVKAWNDGLCVVGIYIHGLKNFEGQISAQGDNPFDYITHNSTKKKLSSIVKCYNPAGSDSKERYAWVEKHLANAIEEAIRIRSEN